MNAYSFLSRTLLVTTLAACAVGCSDDDDDNGNDGGNGGVTGSTGGRSSGGSTSSGGMSGSAGDAGVAGNGGTSSGGSSSGGKGGSGGSTASGGTSTTPDGGGEPDSGVVLNDAQIFGVLDTANTGEVSQGQIAETKAVSTAVKGFATMMVTDHTAAKQKGATLATSLGVTPAASVVRAALLADSQTIVASLNAAAPAEFDRVYMDSQVIVHTKVLAIVDDDLLPHATNAQLKALLTETRATVAAHLAEAKTIAGTLGDQ
jgi:putative membrane protein